MERDASVTVIDDLSTGRIENLPHSPRLNLIQTDIADFPALETLLKNFDCVFHLAAQVGNMKSIENPESDARTNVLGSVRLYNACRNSGIRKLVYASSSAIFGEAETIPIAEDHPQRPASFYALSKQTGEKYALLANTLWNIPTVCTRFFNVYGLPFEKSEYSGVINVFIDNLRAALPLTIYGDGNQIRDFVYVKDVAMAVMLAAEHGLPGSVYNIGSGTAHSILELATLLMDETGMRSEVRHAEFRVGEVKRSAADISLAREKLGYAPSYTLSMGLREIWAGLNGSRTSA